MPDFGIGDFCFEISIRSVTPNNEMDFNAMISNHIQKWLGTQLAGLFCLGVLTMSSGCSALNFSASQSEVTPIAREDSRGLYQVEMSGGFAKAATFQGAIDGDLTVQDALDRSGAIDRFRSMDVMVYRVVEKSGQPLKLPVVYSPRKKSVSPEQDYAIHPGDRIIVQSKSNNAIDKLVDTLNPGEKY